MLNRRSWLAGLGALTTLGGNALAQGKRRIVLGQSAALSGPAAQLGLQFQAGAKLWLDDYNAHSGGSLVELRSLDDGYEPERCAANTKTLIDDGVFALFGYIGTPTGLAALPLVKASGIPFIAPFTGAMGLREPLLRNVFHLRASYNDETALIVNQLVNLGLKKIAVFYQNDSYGKAGLDGTVLALNKRGLKPVATATVERNSVDVTRAVTSLLPAAPDAIVQVSAYASCAAFIRAARKAGFAGTFYNVSFVGTQALADALGADGAGVVVSQVVPSPSSLGRPSTRAFQDSIKATGASVQANYSSMEGYLAARLVTDALDRDNARLPTREGLVRALESLGNHSVAGFPVRLSATSHVASEFVELSMLTGDGRVKT